MPINLRLTDQPRKSWDEYFIGIVAAVAERATCDRGRSGALLVYQRQIIATGYVGSPPGFPHCDDVGHLLEDGHCVRTVHAEQNALAQAARMGVATIGATLYGTMTPCRTCAMLLLTAGIDAVIVDFGYPGDPGRKGVDIFKQAGITYRQLHNTLASYA